MFDNHNHTNSRKVKVISAQQLTPKAGCPSLELQVGCCEVGKKSVQTQSGTTTLHEQPETRISILEEGRARQGKAGSQGLLKPIQQKNPRAVHRGL